MSDVRDSRNTLSRVASEYWEKVCNETSNSANLKPKLLILFYFFLDRGYGVWVAASNKVPYKADFYWADNTPMTNTLWITGYPTHFRAYIRACIWLAPSQGRLADYDCNGNSRPFCQAPHDGVAATCS
jgi:hypothetical protein